MSLYTVKGKGGRYEVLCISKPAGALKTSVNVELVTYRDVDSKEVYTRLGHDFAERMELIDGGAAI